MFFNKQGMYVRGIGSQNLLRGIVPLLHQARIVKLLTQHVVKGDSWVSIKESALLMVGLSVSNLH